MNDFEVVIRPKTKWYEFNFRELLQYRDLVFLFVRRNFVTSYAQTILGPLWLLISPLINTLLSTFVFGMIAKLPTDGIPYALYYMCGNMAWSYFAGCFYGSAYTFTANAPIFGKVYFPRLVMPVSSAVTELLTTAVRALTFVGLGIYFSLTGFQFHITWAILLLPLLLLQLAMLGLGCGILVSSVTTRYRDLSALVNLGMTLWLYATPVVYSINSLPSGLRTLSLLNPVTPVILTVRYACLGTGTIPYGYWGLSIAVTLVILFLGIIVFNQVEKTFMDTV